jgi:hypothetical protein
MAAVLKFNRPLVRLGLYRAPVVGVRSNGYNMLVVEISFYKIMDGVQLYLARCMKSFITPQGAPAMGFDKLLHGWTFEKVLASLMPLNLFAIPSVPCCYTAMRPAG